MLNSDKHINELWSLKHINDNSDINVEYEDKLITKMHSNHIFKNEYLSEFLYKIEKMYIVVLDSNAIIRNWFNYTKDKYDRNVH